MVRGEETSEEVRVRRASRLPDSCPTEAEIITAQDRFNALGLAIDAGLQAERFRNHAEQSDRKCKGSRGWSAAWRNWTLVAIERAQQRPTGATDRRSAIADWALKGDIE